MGDERLALQGVNLEEYGRHLETLSETMKFKLSGNALSFHSFTIGLTAALAHLPIDWM